jgi:hypothetical protein
MFVMCSFGNSLEHSTQIVVELAILVLIFVRVLFSLASFGTLVSEFGESRYHGSSRHVYHRKKEFKVTSV